MAHKGNTSGFSLQAKGILLIAGLAIGLCFSIFQGANPFANSAQRYAQSMSVSSAGVYVTLRTLNAFLSTAQEVEVGGSLIVSGTMQPLKVLEPVDDTIERIAGVVFWVMVATGVLAVALGPTGGIGWALIALACALALAPRGWSRPVLARQLGLYGAVIALAVPLAFVMADATADRMTQAVWSENQRVIDEITGQVQAAPQEDEGWFDIIPGDMEQYQTIAGNVVARADELIASYLAILSVFIFKILVLPALLLGGLWVGLRVLSRPRAQ